MFTTVVDIFYHTTTVQCSVFCSSAFNSPTCMRCHSTVPICSVSTKLNPPPLTLTPLKYHLQLRKTHIFYTLATTLLSSSQNTTGTSEWWPLQFQNTTATHTAHKRNEYCVNSSHLSSKLSPFSNFYLTVTPLFSHKPPSFIKGFW